MVICILLLKKVFESTVCFLCTVKNLKLNFQSFEPKEEDDEVVCGLGKQMTPEKEEELEGQGGSSPWEAAKGVEAE